jgi:transglutaminase-like putative cysteine protease
MRQPAPLFFGLLLVVSPAAAAEPQGKLVEDVWEVAHLGGARAGFFHTTVREIDRGGRKVLRTTMQMELTLQRGSATVQLRAATGTEETPEGKVTAVFMRLPQDRKALVLSGTVEGEGLHVTVDGGRIDKVIRWDEKVIGLAKQERLFKEKTFKPGDRFRYLSYEPTINAVVTVRGKVGEEEEVETLKGKKSLVRVELTPDKVEVPGASVQLPGMVLWLDKEGTPVRRQMEFPGLGQVVSQRTSRAVAEARGGAVARAADILDNTLIPLDRAIRQPHATSSVVYRITVKDDTEPGTAFAQDARQQIKNLKGNTFELHVRAVRAPQRVADPNAEAEPEFLKSCYWLNGNDERVRALAQQAVGEETDPLRKARRIERWVEENVRNDNAVGFAPADEVARSLRGDCRQHAMLAAALCRAAGVPSRTAVGLVYTTDRQKGPVMAFHMWTEVWVRGQWLAIDPTLGQGSIGAAHVKIADSSWHDVQDLKPMLPVARVLGKVRIDVVSVNGTP